MVNVRSRRRDCNVVLPCIGGIYVCSLLGQNPSAEMGAWVARPAKKEDCRSISVLKGWAANYRHGQNRRR
jgi:hypothetical protein